MDVLNFISWIKRKDYRETMPANALTVVGVPDPTRDDKYLSVVVPVTAFNVIIPSAQKGYIDLTQTASNKLTAVSVDLTGTLTYDWSIVDSSTSINFVGPINHTAVQTFEINLFNTLINTRPVLVKAVAGETDAYKYSALIKVIATDEDGYFYPAYFNFSMYTASLYE